MIRVNPKAGMAVGLAAAFIVWAVMYLGGARIESGLESGCRGLIEGADLEEVVAALGMQGYRPGCATETSNDPSAGMPCQRATVGSVADFPYLCEGSDCSLYWRVGDVACLVELDGELHVTASAFMSLGAGVTGTE